MPIKKILKNKLGSKKDKLILYWTILRPAITHASETWVLKESVKRKLFITERNMLRRIFGPTKDRDCTWRVKTNDELNNIVRYKNIINYCKAQMATYTQ
jgi:hypothetical protein